MSQTFEPQEFHRAGGKRAGRWTRSISAPQIVCKAERKRKVVSNVELIFIPNIIIKKNFKAAIVLQNVCDARARKLEAEVDPEGPDHNKRPRDPQHSPRRHLIHKLSDFKHLQQMEINW